MLIPSLLLLSYLLGSLPFGVAVTAILGGQDPRTGGSLNPGATNVARLNGWTQGGVTLALDLLKGLVPTALALSLAGPGVAAAVGLVAVIGHCWSVYLAFSGGKGVATAAGVMLALAPAAALLAALIWGLVFAIGRRSSVAALVAAGALPLLCLALGTGAAWVALSLAALVLLRHRANLRRLIAGSEEKLSIDRSDTVR